MPIDVRSKLLKYRRTKIVATLGPASRSPEVVKELIRAGVNVFRMNFSHGTHESHRENFERIHAAREELGLPIAVLADLCGPKIRVGRFPGGSIELTAGEAVTVTTREVEGGAGLIPSAHAALHEDVLPGHRLLLDDGKLELRVENVEGRDIACTVVTGGTLKDAKGMNLPDVEVSVPALTDKDREDARLALELGVDLLALSFVRKAQDVLDLRELVSAAGSSTSLIAKIEKPQALDALEEIMRAADGIMVARGDLGVEMPPESVPIAQDQMIDLARSHAKPVIVATQMLESMIDNPRPTRAEVTDVANAVRAGADAVMLSAETAAGRHPLEAVRMMDAVARRTEAYQWARGTSSIFAPADTGFGSEPLRFEDALSRSTTQLSRDLEVRCIGVVSRHGRSPAVVAASRPSAPVLAIFTDERLCRVSNLTWGTIPRRADEERFAHPEELVRELALELELGEPGQAMLIVQGFSTDPELNRPSVMICRM